MLNFTSTLRYYIYRPPTDMRKGFNGLSGLIDYHMGKDSQDGRVYLFINRRRDKLKILLWDRSGYVIYYKRLESGTFELPKAVEGRDHYTIYWSELVCILEGISLKSVHHRRRYKQEKSIKKIG